MKTLVVVDAQKDFISGSLACEKGRQAMEAIVELIENNPEMRVLYTGDWHGENNKSFKVNGGIWPVHCVAGTEGAELYPEFYILERIKQRPGEDTLFLKGKNDEVEEYSAAKGTNAKGEVLEEVLDGEVWVAGLASEYCVRETILDLAEKGISVSMYLPGVGYVDKKDHEKNLQDLEKREIPVITK